MQRQLMIEVELEGKRVARESLTIITEGRKIKIMWAGKCTELTEKNITTALIPLLISGE